AIRINDFIGLKWQIRYAFNLSRLPINPPRARRLSIMIPLWHTIHQISLDIAGLCIGFVERAPINLLPRILSIPRIVGCDHHSPTCLGPVNNFLRYERKPLGLVINLSTEYVPFLKSSLSHYPVGLVNGLVPFVQRQRSSFGLIVPLLLTKLIDQEVLLRQLDRSRLLNIAPIVGNIRNSGLRPSLVQCFLKLFVLEIRLGLSNSLLNPRNLGPSRRSAKRHPATFRQMHRRERQLTQRQIQQ